jgi:hypothetical protein
MQVNTITDWTTPLVMTVTLPVTNARAHPLTVPFVPETELRHQTVTVHTAPWIWVSPPVTIVPPNVKPVNTKLITVLYVTESDPKLEHPIAHAQ